MSERVRHFDTILMTATLALCLLFVRACQRSAWPFKAATLAVAVLPPIVLLNIENRAFVLSHRRT